MGKHNVAPRASGPRARVPASVGSTGLGLPGRIALVAAAVITVIGAGVLLGPREALANLPWARATPCSAETVDVVVAPELVSTVSQILLPVRGQEVDADHHCVAVQVRGQEPQDTAASAELLPPDRAPNIWIPDSQAWVSKADRWSPQPAGHLASSPVVITTSTNAARALGWQKTQPTWQQAMRGRRSVAIPDFRSQSESLDALIALWQSLGEKRAADEAVVATVFAGDRQEVPTPSAALANARSGSTNAALIPSTEQQVAYVNALSLRPNLVAIYPKEGSPLLDYPILRSGGQHLSAARQAATDAVLRQLQSARSRELVRHAGFRDPQGGDPVGSGIDPSRSKKLTPPSTAAVNGMIGRVEALARPSRLLAVFDVSLSMRAKLDDGVTRIQLAASATRLGVNLLPDSSSVGAWVFAANMGDGRDYKSVAPVRRLGAATSSGQSYRSQLLQLTASFDRFLTPGGTGLYDTTSAAAKYMHSSFDPKAVNAIILLSDGANEDSNSASLNEVVSQIKRQNSGRQKVAIYTAGLGPDADYAALGAIANASGGHSYRIDTAAEGQEALLDGLRRSRALARIGS